MFPLWDKRVAMKRVVAKYAVGDGIKSEFIVDCIVEIISEEEDLLSQT